MPRYLEIYSPERVATLHFPAGVYTLSAVDKIGCYYRAPRNAHNPKTGKRLITTPKYRPHFKPGKALRERVNNSKDKN